MAACQVQQRSAKTSYLYVCWARRYVMFHQNLHPAEMGATEVVSFVTHLALTQAKSRATCHQALQALRFLYRHVLQSALAKHDLRSLTSRAPHRLPHIPKPEEVLQTLQQLVGMPRLVAMLLYGSGLRIHEALDLQVQDVIFDTNRLVIRGDNPRQVPLARVAVDPLQEQVRTCLALAAQDLGEAAINPGCQFVFVGERTRMPDGTYIRRPPHAKTIQRALAATTPHLSAYLLRQAFAVHLLDQGTHVCVVHSLLGQRDIHSALRYQRVSTQGPVRVRSPVDDLILGEMAVQP